MVADGYCASCTIDKFYVEIQAFTIDDIDCDRLKQECTMVSDFFQTFIHEEEMEIKKLTKMLTIIDVPSSDGIDSVRKKHEPIPSLVPSAQRIGKNSVSRIQLIFTSLSDSVDVYSDCRMIRPGDESNEDMLAIDDDTKSFK